MKLSRNPESYFKVRLAIAITAWLIAILLLYVHFAQTRGYRETSFRNIARSNLKYVLTERHLQAGKSEGPIPMDVGTARRGAISSLSPYSEKDRIQGRTSLHWFVRDHVFPAFAVALVISSLCLLVRVGRSEVRIAAWTAMLLAWIAAFGMLFPDFLKQSLIPGSTAYVDDYVYVEGIHPAWDCGDDVACIVAFSRSDEFGRIVGYASGLTGVLETEEFEAIMRSLEIRVLGERAMYEPQDAGRE